MTNKNIKCLEIKGKCPPKILSNNKFGILLNGNANNLGNLLTPGLRYSSKINTAIIGRVGWKVRYVNNNINFNGQYFGGSSGYGNPPRNKF